MVVVAEVVEVVEVVVVVAAVGEWRPVTCSTSERRWAHNTPTFCADPIVASPYPSEPLVPPPKPRPSLARDARCGRARQHLVRVLVREFELLRGEGRAVRELRRIAAQ